ncbi:MAG: hypothetical protein Q9218_003576 [Villophora microphyllina]
MASIASTSEPAMNPAVVQNEKTFQEAPSPSDSQSLEGSVKGDIEKQTPDSTESEKGAIKSDDGPNYPPTREVLPIMLALYLAMFLTALDRTIIATAIPYITNDLDSFGDVGWYGSSYMLTFCSFLLLMGRVYTFYSPKWIFLASIFVFELGSAVSGAAPTSTGFVIGRAITGLGSAGMINGAIIVMFHIIPLAKRPTWSAGFGSIMGISSVVGPLLGGAFTQNVSWRWCFYINLPIGALAMVIVVMFLKVPSNKTPKSLKEQIAQLDPIGTTLFLPGIICLLLALQWGGSTYAWNSGRIIALLVIFGICACAFIAVQAWKGDMATVPPHIIKQRSIAATFWFSFCNGGAMQVVVYYLPIWFQAIKDASPVHSGIMLLGTLLSLVVATISSGIFIKKVGYYTPSLIASSVIMPIGLGLLTTLTPETGHAKWIGYQILFGFGLGLGFQQGNLAAQTVLAKKDVPTGVSLNSFAQLLGGTLFVSIGENILINHLRSGLSSLPNFDPNSVVSTGATEIKSVVGLQNLGFVKLAYNNAIMKVFDVALVLSCLTIIASLAVEWKNIKAQKDHKQAQAQVIFEVGRPPSDHVIELDTNQGGGELMKYEATTTYVKRGPRFCLAEREELLEEFGVQIEPEVEKDFGRHLRELQDISDSKTAAQENLDQNSSIVPQDRKLAPVANGEIVVKNGKDRYLENDLKFMEASDILPVSPEDEDDDHQAHLHKITMNPHGDDLLLGDPIDRERYDSHTLWTLTGVAMRIAQRMGSHRDGADLKLPAFETEMHQRLWWQILQLEIRAAEFSGVGQTIREMQWTTRVPLNLNDTNLYPAMEDTTAEQKGVTEMIYCLVRYKIGMIMKSARGKSMVDRSLKPLHSSEVPVQEKEKIIQGAEELFEQKYLRYCDPSIPLHFISALMARSIACKMRFRTYHPRHFWAMSEPVSQEEKDLLFTVSVKILKYDNIVENTSTAQRYLWYIRLQFQFDALIHVLGELRSRTASDKTNRAWQQADKVFKHHPDILTDTRKGLHVAMTRLVVRAWDNYEDSCSRDQQPLYEEKPPLFREALISRDASLNADQTVDATENLDAQERDQEAMTPAGTLLDTLGRPLEFNGPPMDSTRMDWSAWDDLLQNFELNPIGPPFK